MTNKTPRCMSTQHPDNVALPFFANSDIIEGEAEIDEAYYAFSHLGCEEQMWDYEGKEVDSHVIRKLIAEKESFFKENVLGKDVFITFRVPNPAVEKNEGKVLLETLESIPRNYDVASKFYNADITPIFEVILPMTTSSAELERVYEYYKKCVAGKQERKIFDMLIGEWIGKFSPSEIKVIPLVEDIPSILSCDKITEEFLKNKKIDKQRVFLARSDPAENYGYVSAFLANEIALYKLHELEKKLGKEILPIFGAGSVPFRGNLNPKNIENCLTSYPSVQTFTIQSAFKYDYPFEDVREAIQKLKNAKRSAPREVDEAKSLEIIEKYSNKYREGIKDIAQLVNIIAKYVPQRRKRKLHIGLFGYSRDLNGEGEIKLPRAIAFCCALYSIGVPPEVIGIDALNKSDFEYLKRDKNFLNDVRDSLAYSNPDILFSLFPSLEYSLGKIGFSYNEQHAKLSAEIYNVIKSGNSDSESLTRRITEAAHIRKFIG